MDLCSETTIDTEDDSPDEAELFTGNTGTSLLGRYIVLEVLGRGGMGIVYRAFDPKLERQLALKVVRPSGRENARLRQRMIGEAQTMAKLDHPNIVGVYEVGEVGEQVFVAMELVKGKNLREWLAEKRRGWREVLAVLLQAGRGLAAAHGEKVVHRDFKPDNVFVGDDTRVRVGDFGIAQREDDPETLKLRAEARAVQEANKQVTMAGALVGTPAYMAPELFRGEPADHRSDQFAFCVTAWEALYGVRPLTGIDAATTLWEAVKAGKREPIPTDRKVPAWIRNVLDRGLCVDPDARFATTQAMLAALEANPTRRRVMLGTIIATFLVLAGWFGAAKYLDAQQIATCEAEGATIEEVWNEAAKTRLHQGLLATGASYAETMATKVTPYFEAQSEAWEEARTQACLEATVKKTWDDETLNRAKDCLDDRKAELKALLETLATTDQAGVQLALEAAAHLSTVTYCTDTRVLDAMPSASDYDRRDIQAIRDKLFAVQSLRATGAYTDGLRMAKQTVEMAEDVGWRPLIASAYHNLGLLFYESEQFQEAEQTLERAYFSGLHTGTFELALDAAIALADTVVSIQKRHEDGLRWLQHADSLLSLVGNTEASRLRASAIKSNRGTVFRSMGRFQEAVNEQTSALHLQEKLLPPMHPLLAETRNSLALTLEASGESSEAEVHFRAAIAQLETSHGHDHPNVATTHFNLVGTLLSLGKKREAEASLKTVLDIYEKTYGAESLAFASALDLQGQIADAQEDYPKAIDAYRRALSIKESKLPAHHPNLITNLNNLALSLDIIGAQQEAIIYYERALDIAEQTLGPEHPTVATLLANLGVVDQGRGDYARAAARHRRALAISEKVYGADNPQTARCLIRLADALDFAGEKEEAEEHYLRSLSILEAHTETIDQMAMTTALNNLGTLYNSTGRLDDAKSSYLRSLAIEEKLSGPESTEIAATLTNLGNIFTEMAEYDQAQLYYERALKIREKALGPNHPEVAFPVTGLVLLALARGEPEAALPHAKRAVRIRESSEVAVEDLAYSRFNLAKVLWALPGRRANNRNRALELAQQARDTYLMQEGMDEALAEVEALLKRARRRR